MKYWSREDTRNWILKLENRLQDIDYFLNQTVAWCEDHYVYNDREVFMLSFLTVIWVSHMRGEPITYVELLELLGMEEMIVGEDKTYDLGEEFIHMGHEQILELMLKGIRSGGNYLPS